MGEEIEHIHARPSRHNVCAVIVTFHPSISIASLFASVAQQSRRFVVVDNRSNRDEILMLRSLCSAYRATLIENAENRGVADAINQGLDFAMAQQEIEWVLLFDQDSEPFPSLIEELAVVHDRYPNPAIIGILAPNVLERGTGKPRHQQSSSGDQVWVERVYSISSGSLIPVEVIRTCGKMRSEFFIDEVDHDFGFRLMECGYRVVMSPKPLMWHSIGRREAHTLFGRTVYTSNHRPERHYYMARNELVLAKEQFLKRPRWVLAILRSRISALVLVCIFEDRPAEKIRYAVRGWLDGLFSQFKNSPLSTRS